MSETIENAHACQSEPSFWWPVIRRWQNFKRTLRRRVPRLVWYGQEIDAHITFSQFKLDPDDPMGSLFGGKVFEIEQRLRELGVGFDRGIGFDGRDWEWDWSLKGPISVKFVGHAREPQKRKEKPRPKLIFSRGEVA